MLELVDKEVGIRLNENKQNGQLNLKKFAASFFTLGIAVGSVENDKLLPSAISLLSKIEKDEKMTKQDGF